MRRISELARKIGLPWPSLRCSFCGADANDVPRLVAGATAHICDSCVSKCVAILEQHGGLPPRAPIQ